MTELEFISSNPSSYGGVSNANLLISSSVVEPFVDNTPLPPYVIQGVSIPFNAPDGTSIQSALKEAEEIRFEFTEGVVSSKILSRQKQNGWYFLKLEPVSVNTLPPVVSTVGVGTPAEQDIYRYDSSEIIFVPYIQLSFINNDYNPLFNNATISKKNAVAQIVDRSSDAANPTNLQAIINFTATEAEIQNCSYTKAGIVNARYDGSKLNSGSIPGNDPALGLREFEGALYSKGSSTTTVQNISLSDREIINLYFKPETVGTHPTKVVETFPTASRLVYQEQGNRFIRVVDRKIFAVETGTVYTTDELGFITLVE